MPEFAPIINVSTLNGNNGFRLDGPAGTYSGNAVASLGDVNGDGRIDLLIGAETNRGAYLVLGTASNPATRAISDLVTAGSAYFFLGEQAGDHTGCSVSSVGDVNGDGINDLLIGAYQADPDGHSAAGTSYLVFGGAANLEALDQASGDDGVISLADLDMTRGFRLDGNNPGDQAGTCVAGAGDVNGDGFADLIIGAPYAETAPGTNNGVSYIVFGGSHLATIDQADGLEDGKLDLTRITGATGAIINGDTSFNGDLSGICVAGAGDVNGDGFDDALIVASSADPNSGAGNSDEGAVYLVFGRSDGTGFPIPLDLGGVDLLDFVRFDGDPTINASLVSANCAGDLNADGLADIAFGTMAATGSAYVVFGKSIFAEQTDLTGLNGTNGFRIDGMRSTDFVGNWISSAGDVNGDGFGDLLIAAGDFDRIDARDVGAAYVVFGKAGGFPSSLDLGALNGNDGFRIEGTFANDALGWSAGVAAAGDINGDGFDDIMVGALAADYGASNSGSTYIIYGHRANSSVTRIGTEIDNHINGGKGDDLIKGFDGNDILLGWEGDDTIWGGADNDKVIIAAGDDELHGGSGRDTLSFEKFSNPITANLATGKFTLPSGDIQSVFSFENVFGGSNRDTITGDARANGLNGAGGNDTIAGGAGNDTLTGGAGADQLNGGTDVDRFAYAALADSGITAMTRDTIVAFGNGQDKIDVSAIDAKVGIAHNQAFTFDNTFGIGDIRSTQQGSDTLIEFNTDNDAAAEMSILLKSFTATNITGADFVL